MAKWIKNVSGAEKSWNGQGFTHNVPFEIPEEEDHHWRGNDDIVDAINNSDAEIGDGTNWFTGQEALDYLCAIHVNSTHINITSTKTPSSATDNGVKGTICWDANYLYICTATNTWKRVALNTW